MKIHQDDKGRYCLNDCHKASGAGNKNRPSIWADNSQTKALIAEIQSEAGIPALVVSKGGNASGTYACKELVYAYAMWISPAFHLQVIRAFDALVTGKVHTAPVVDQLNDPAFLRGTLLTYTEKVLALEAEKAEAAPKVEGFERLANSKGRTNLREVGKELKIGSTRGIELLREVKWIYRDGRGIWKAYSGAIDRGYVEMKYTTFKNSSGEETSTQQVFVTPRGMARLAVRLQLH
ncbi:phage antirepressor KilAC domain-containing protein [Acetobacter thailandicus]|uniref:phage antirepressor KilAC domain-containing protein n=1 Tax=Acetobacter thailandicus TaxID=1502842 RepID=UPI001BAB75B1|nr:phage antirepressor KilAC domain-containing protein [Acetobacter thailandicus]MBS1003197.1 phage antirepressor KilAC domain-containing protein [Acetobacter thailandicus]